jgi:trk system potassium uptake protein TrkA
MFVAIVGCSAVGYHLAKALLAVGHEVIVIERNPVRSRMLNEELGSVVLQGDGTDATTLKLAGASRADILAAVTDVDETNLVACQLAKHLFHVPRTMALVRDTKNEPVFQVLGVDVVVNATHLVVTRLEEGVPGSPLVHLLNLRAPGTALVGIAIPDDAAAVGRRLDELVLPPHSFISLVVKGNQAELPVDSLVLEGRDEVIAVTMTDEEQTLYHILTGA